jgi:type I restriction enzyme S subunit
MRAGWTNVAFKEVFDLDLEAVDVDPSVSYQMVGVLSYGRGLFSKPPVGGADTSYKTFYRLRSGQIVVSQLFGWEGAIAPVTSEFVGSFVSSQFPTFRPKANLDAGFARWMIRHPIVWEQLKAAAKGLGDRRRTLSPEIFFGVTSLLPPMAEQQRIVAHLDAIEVGLNRTQKLRGLQDQELNATLNSSFHKLESEADWVEMGEVAPLYRRPKEITLDGEYPELGTRSFGRGIFHKPTLRGESLTWQKLFQVHAGDIVISNIKAWEGALAVAHEADHGRYGSHRYLTCTVDPDRALPEFVCFYLLSPSGLEKIGLASPGSADRNRTLAVDRLNKIKVPIVPLATQAEFQKLLDMRTKVRMEAAQASRHTTALLPSLLDRIFNS